MNKRRWVIASIAVFIVVTILEFIHNSYCFKGIYAATANLWRPEADIMKLMPYYWAASFIASFFFVYIYAKGYEAKPSKIAEGFRFGLTVGLFINLPMATIVYATMPVPVRLPVDWFITGLVQYIVAGVVAGLIYKR